LDIEAEVDEEEDEDEDMFDDFSEFILSV